MALRQCLVPLEEVEPRAVGVPSMLLAVAGVLTLLATVAGARAWDVPQRVYSGWQVAAVPWSMWLLLALSVAVCVIPALALLRRALGVRALDPPMRAWSGVVVVAVGALVFNALVLGADSAVDSGPPIPLFHWAFTAVTAVLAGKSTALAAPDRDGAGVLAAVASGVVTLPLFTLGWALYTSRLPDAEAVLATLTLSGVLGALPLLIAVAVVAASDARRERIPGSS